MGQGTGGAADVATRVGEGFHLVDRRTRRAVPRAPELLGDVARPDGAAFAAGTVPWHSRGTMADPGMVY